MFNRKPKCQHHWELIKEVMMPSGYEQVGKELAGKATHIDHYMFQKTLVLTFTCKKCGELRIDKTVNPK